VVEIDGEIVWMRGVAVESRYCVSADAR
jgi:hypothetical protein